MNKRKDIIILFGIAAIIIILLFIIRGLKDRQTIENQAATRKASFICQWIISVPGDYTFEAQLLDSDTNLPIRAPEQVFASTETIGEIITHTFTDLNIEPGQGIICKIELSDTFCPAGSSSVEYCFAEPSLSPSLSPSVSPSVSPSLSPSLSPSVRVPSSTATPSVTATPSTTATPSVTATPSTGAPSSTATPSVRAPSSTATPSPGSCRLNVRINCPYCSQENL